MSERGDALAERLVGSVLGVMDIYTVYLGEKLGLYSAMTEGAVNSGELAEKTGIAERYAREWLEQQAAAGFVDCEDPGAPPLERRFHLPAEHHEVLLDPDSLSYLVPMTRMLVATGQQLPALMDAYRTGGGVGWAEFGDDMRIGQELTNRPAFLAFMDEWVRVGLPDVHQKMGTGGGAKIADVGCGGGWSTIALARAYPQAEVHGFDLDEPSIERARANAAAEEVADRVTFHAVDPAEAGPSHRYDLVTAFECIHDMSHPVPVLATMREIAGDDGAVMVMDERVAHEYDSPADEVERLMYGYSTLVCLPDGMSHPDSVGTGTVMRPETLARYADDAGYARVEILPIEADFWRFYRLHP